MSEEEERVERDWNLAVRRNKVSDKEFNICHKIETMIESHQNIQRILQKENNRLQTEIKGLQK